MSLPRHFWALCLTGWLAFSPALVAAARCQLDAASGKGVVAYVNDGDTLTLKDGRRLRLLGFDTPEIDHAGGRAEPFALAARQRLMQLAPPGSEVLLRRDSQHRDKYRRHLVRLFTRDGTSIAEQQLRAGLAVLLIMPPNLWQLDCLIDAEADARAARRGLWSLPRYQPHSARNVSPDNHYQQITGRVTQSWEKNGSLYVLLDDRVLARVAPAERALFALQTAGALKGHRLLITGRLHPYRRPARASEHKNHIKGYLRLYHPHALQMLGN